MSDGFDVKKGWGCHFQTPDSSFAAEVLILQSRNNKSTSAKLIFPFHFCFFPFLWNAHLYRSLNIELLTCCSHIPSGSCVILSIQKFKLSEMLHHCHVTDHLRIIKTSDYLLVIGGLHHLCKKVIGSVTVNLQWLVNDMGTDKRCWQQIFLKTKYLYTSVQRVWLTCLSTSTHEDLVLMTQHLVFSHSPSYITRKKKVLTFHLKELL